VVARGAIGPVATAGDARIPGDAIPRPFRLSRAPLPCAPRAALVVAGALLLPPPAGALAAAPHGSAAPASPPAVAPPAQPPGVAAAAVGRPTVEAVTCRTDCLGLATATRGSVVRVTGEDAGSAAAIVFLGRRGRGDDAVAPARALGPGAAEATLPAGAHGGPVRLLTADHRRSARSSARLVVRRGDQRPGALDARVSSRRIYVDATRRATLDVFVGGSGAANVVVDVVRPGDGAVLAHWVLPGVPGGTVQSVEWDGTAAGAEQPEGRYVFRASASVAVARTADSATPGQAPPHASSFVLLRNRFPVRGAHGYGEAGARFGAGRTGHVHQGQDVFAACGTPLVAAHGGDVKSAGFQGAAGNYLVIATDEGVDHDYMHLRDPALVPAGTSVATGEPVGFVGDTGDAQGCHLHFEIWPGAGWRSDEAPVDPLPSLQAWDERAA
jgi:murein DD-endopeptidase MepM/ murein hydrolase activator NlpD